jgi:hypothetical protein
LSGSSYSFDRAAPGVTAAIITSGVVLSYTQLTGDGTTTRPLPATTISGANAIIWNYVIPAAGTIRYTVIDPGAALAPSPSLLNQFRYVIIPGGVAGGKTTGIGGTNYSEQEIRSMSYAQVCKLFNIRP